VADTSKELLEEAVKTFKDAGLTAYAQFIESLAAERDDLAERVRVLGDAVGEMVRADATDARRLRACAVEALRQLKKGRALWNGPAHQCAAVLEQALTVDNGADAIAAMLKGPTP
jgi:hypothetical protein